jgi:hypothetical protein
MTFGALEVVMGNEDDTDALFKYEQVHISVTEYRIDCPRVIVVSMHDVAFRNDGIQTVVETDDDPMILETFQDEKLQKELEQELEPAVQPTDAEPCND